MLRVTVELVPHGVGPPTVIGRAVIGQVPATAGQRCGYVASVWDDWHFTTPVQKAVDHDRRAGVWELVRTVLAAVHEGTGEAVTDPWLRGLLDRHFRDETGNE